MFRGIKIDNNRWIEGWLIKSRKSYYIFSGLGTAKTCGEDSCHFLTFYHSFNEIFPESIAMKTGVKDKNEKDIYGSIEISGEMTIGGDIIVADCYPYFDENKPNYIAAVEWHFSGFHTVLKCINSEKRGISEGINEPLEEDNFFRIVRTQWEDNHGKEQ